MTWASVQHYLFPGDNGEIWAESWYPTDRRGQWDIKYQKVPGGSFDEAEQYIDQNGGRNDDVKRINPDISPEQVKQMQEEARHYFEYGSDD